jgi:hypothetical protein
MVYVEDIVMQALKSRFFLIAVAVMAFMPLIMGCPRT